MKPTIGQNIASYRKKAGMTQEELSEKLGVTAQAISKWENDLSYPDLEIVRKLASIFGITVDQLLNGEDSVPAVKVVETEHPEKRILLISTETKNTLGASKVNLRLPVGLIKKAYETGKLEELVGDSADILESAMQFILQGTVGPIVDVENEDATVHIEVIDYES